MAHATQVVVLICGWGWLMGTPRLMEEGATLQYVEWHDLLFGPSPANFSSQISLCGSTTQEDPVQVKAAQDQLQQMLLRHSPGNLHVDCRLNCLAHCRLNCIAHCCAVALTGFVVALTLWLCCNMKFIFPCLIEGDSQALVDFVRVHKTQFGGGAFLRQWHHIRELSTDAMCHCLLFLGVACMFLDFCYFVFAFLLSFFLAFLLSCFFLFFSSTSLFLVSLCFFLLKKKTSRQRRCV